MECVRRGQGERCNRAVKLLSVIGQHLVTALHAADRGLQHGAAGITKTFAGFQVRLFADHTFPTHFLGLAIGIGDDPVTGQ